MTTIIEVRGRTELIAALEAVRYAGDDSVEITAVRKDGGTTRFTFPPAAAWVKAEHTKLKGLYGKTLKAPGRAALERRMTDEGLETAYAARINQFSRNLKKTPKEYWD